MSSLSLRLTRRRLLAAGGVAAIGAAGAGTYAAVRDRGTVRSAPPTNPVQFHVVAHPDDDLYFLNPDVRHAVTAGARIVSVCVTTGEADGRNVHDSSPEIRNTRVDYPAYAKARQNGLRAAYAEMVVGDAGSPWDHQALRLPGGAPAEVSTLTAAPWVQLIFLNLWDQGEHSPERIPARLRLLWSGQSHSHPTLRPAGSPMPTGYVHTRATLIQALADLLDRFRPTVVRTMDPDPDFQVHDAANPQYSDWGHFSDHDDHTATALFTWAAVQEHCQRGGQVAVESYRGYYNQRWPQNLSRAAYDGKLSLLNVYGWADDRDCGDPAGCGDRKVGGRARERDYGHSTTHRYGASATWLQRDSLGRLTAFAVLGGSLVTWVEHAPGSGQWDPPTVVPAGNLVPYLAPVRNKAGGWQVFGVKMVLSADRRRQTRVLTTVGQAAPGKPFGAWTDLGNPNEDHPDKRRGIGMPAVSAEADGRLRVFVRNFGAGVSSRVQSPDGGWDPWLDLSGSGTQDGLTAVTTRDGRIEVYASTKTGIMRWYQRAPNGPFTKVRLDVPAPASPPTVVERPDGRLMLLVRQPETAALLAYDQVEPGGDWDRTPRMLGGHLGFGPVAAARNSGGDVAIAERNDSGTVSVGWRPAGHTTGELSWAEDGPVFLHTPAAAIDVDGRLAVAAIGLDGRLHLARQRTPDHDSPLQTWTTAAGPVNLGVAQ